MEHMKRCNGPDEPQICSSTAALQASQETKIRWRFICTIDHVVLKKSHILCISFVCVLLIIDQAHSQYNHHHAEQQQEHFHGNSSLQSVGSSSRRSHRSNQSQGSRSRGRSRSRDYYKGDGNDDRAGRPRWKNHEKNSYHQRNGEGIRRGSPPRGDSYNPKFQGRRNGDNAQDYHHYGSEGFDGESYHSERWRDDSSFASHPRGRRRGQSQSVDETLSLPSHGRSFPTGGEDGTVSPEQSSPFQSVTEEWPPCFDTDGSAFVFDTRSGMFYESLSDFFYDPKSKLYYGNRKGSYFRYDSTKDPPFDEVQKVADSSASAIEDACSSLMDQVPLQSAKMQGSESSKPKIAIKLKTKKIKSSSANTPAASATGVTAPSAVTKSQKEKIANIEKWTEKQAELKQEISGDSSSEAPNPSTNAADVRMTAKGEPICVVCRRKFPSIEKLRLHERASDLHKQNLQKRKESEAVAGDKRKFSGVPNETAPPYQDRAEKRRLVHGSNVAEMHPHRLVVDNLQHYGPASKGEALDESHVGHKMLQKLGWKGHGNEGQMKNGRTATTNVASDQLRKDWDRIETLAGNPSHPGSDP